MNAAEMRLARSSLSRSEGFWLASRTPGVVLAAVPCGSVDEASTRAECRERPGLVEEDALAGMDVAEVHGPLGEPRSEVEHAHAQPLVQVLGEGRRLIRERQPAQAVDGQQGVGRAGVVVVAGGEDQPAVGGPGGLRRKSAM